MTAAPHRNWTRCPACGGPSRIADHWITPEGLYARRRECLRCPARWSTEEHLRDVQEQKSIPARGDIGP